MMRSPESAAATQNLRDMSFSSWFSSSPEEASRGSSAIPQIGQIPGASRTICGCIGQVHSLLWMAAGWTGSSAIPHLGQDPGPGCRTSGCIGQVYALSLRAALWTLEGCDDSFERKALGSSRNRARQCALQKRYSTPSCRSRCGPDAATVMPQTGSVLEERLSRC